MCIMDKLENSQIIRSRMKFIQYTVNRNASYIHKFYANKYLFKFLRTIYFQWTNAAIWVINIAYGILRCFI